MSTFFNNLESYGLFLIYKMLIWTSRNIPNVGLFSAYAEVFPASWSCMRSRAAFLCLRRGVSFTPFHAPGSAFFSLPTQRCFSLATMFKLDKLLFSAYAEVFPTKQSAVNATKAFLCLRRGVSVAMVLSGGSADFSLPTQRCFRWPWRRTRPARLFSAYAEVFPL